MRTIFSISLWLRLGLFAALLMLPLHSKAAEGTALQIVSQSTNIVVSWPAVNSDFGMQYCTNLNSPNWLILPSTNVAIVNDNYVVTNQIGTNASFYRLISPCGELAPPTLGPVPSQNITSTRYITLNGEPVNDPNYPSWILGDGTNVFDASAFVDPSSCVPGTLKYHWVVCYIRDDGTEVVPYADVAITGYLKPVLTINPDAMPAGNGYILLTVTSNLHPEQSTTIRINIEIDTNTRLQISNYLQCQATASLCDVHQAGCLCFIPAALPTTEPTR